MTLIELLRHHQGGRSLRDYAELLGVSPSHLSQVYSGIRNAEGGYIVTGFLRAFPSAADELSAALAVADSERTEVPA